MLWIEQHDIIYKVEGYDLSHHHRARLLLYLLETEILERLCQVSLP
jgi:hypothetical protein